MVQPKRLPCGRTLLPDSDSLHPTNSPDWQKRLQDYLEGEGLRSSDQRWKIAELLLATGEHLSAQEILDRVRTAYPEIGAATVYRNIKVLCEAMILKESLSDAEGRTVYERGDEGHHDHIVCLDCGEIFEFHDEAIEALQDSVTQKLNFEPIRHRHVIYAQCQFKRKSQAKSF